MVLNYNSAHKAERKVSHSQELFAAFIITVLYTQKEHNQGSSLLVRVKFQDFSRYFQGLQSRFKVLVKYMEKTAI